MTSTLIVFLQGFTVAGAWVAALFFLRFWRDSRDRLFALFSAAFWILGASWMLLALLGPAEDGHPYVYALRLAGFVLIIASIVDKNISARAPR